MGILSRKMGSWSLSSSLLIIMIYIIIVKIIRENEVVESILRKPVWQPKTSHCF
jgi:hypothetical protein